MKQENIAQADFVTPDEKLIAVYPFLFICFFTIQSKYPYCVGDFIADWSKDFQESYEDQLRVSIKDGHGLYDEHVTLNSQQVFSFALLAMMKRVYSDYCPHP